MNQTSLEKIQTASTFLHYFRRSVPIALQAKIRPYLDQPYQLALRILDCCDEMDGCTTEAIAQRLAISKSSVRQVLSALREGGLVFTTGATRSWLPMSLEPLPTSKALTDRSEPVHPC